MKASCTLLLAGLTLAAQPMFDAAASAAPIELGDRRELLVDRFLIDEYDNADLRMHHPVPATPPEKPVAGDGFRLAYAYAVIFEDGDIFRKYGRRWLTGLPLSGATREETAFNEVYLYAESEDGINWVEPNLGIYDDIPEMEKGNVVFAWDNPGTHNFAPFIDTRPGVPAEQRYKAIGGHNTMGLFAYVSADGLHWSRMQEEPIIPADWGFYDSQNLAFWSEAEGQYVAYWRVFANEHTPRVRSVRRAVSDDFINWTQKTDVKINLPLRGGRDAYSSQHEQLYTPNIKPYFRAPHIYVSLPAEILFDRLAAMDVHLATSRDGIKFDRTFTDIYLRPSVISGYSNRSHYAAHHVIQTGDDELSLYNYHGKRWTLRLDGFASLYAPFEGGEAVTRTVTFEGDKLEINARTAGAGFVRVELLDADGEPIAGYTLDDCDPFTGDSVDHRVSWNGSTDLGTLAGRPIRIRFVMKDADLYALRFH